MILSIIVSTNGLLYEDSRKDIALTNADLSSIVSQQYISQDFQLMIRFWMNELCHANPLDQFGHTNDHQGPSQYKDSPSRYVDSHGKDKTVTIFDFKTKFKLIYYILWGPDP